MAGPSNVWVRGARGSYVLDLLHSYASSCTKLLSWRSELQEFARWSWSLCNMMSVSFFMQILQGELIKCFTLSFTGRWTTCPIQRVGWCVCLKSWCFASVLWPLWMIPRSKEYIRYHCMLGYLVFRETHMLGGYVTICYLTCQESEFSEYLGLAMWKSAFTPNAQRNIWSMLWVKSIYFKWLQCSWCLHVFKL